MFAGKQCRIASSCPFWRPVVFEYKHVVQSVRLLNENKAVPQIQQGTTTTVAPNEATINVEVKP